MELSDADVDNVRRNYYDRNGRFGRPPTRDLLITATRERHPELFTRAALRP